MASVGARLKFVCVSFCLPSFSFSSIYESDSEVLVVYNIAQSVPILVLRGLFRILSLALIFGARAALERVDFLHHVHQHFHAPTHLFLELVPYNIYNVHFPCSRRTLLSFVTFVLLYYRMLLPVSAIYGRSPFPSGQTTSP